MEWIPATLSVLGAIVVAWLGKRASQNAAKTAATAAPYDELAERTAKLEKQVDRMRAELHNLHGDFDLVADAFWDIVTSQESTVEVSDRVKQAMAIVQRRRSQREKMLLLLESQYGDGEVQDG